MFEGAPFEEELVRDEFDLLEPAVHDPAEATGDAICGEIVLLWGVNCHEGRIGVEDVDFLLIDRSEAALRLHSLYYLQGRIENVASTTTVAYILRPNEHAQVG